MIGREIMAGQTDGWIDGSMTRNWLMQLLGLESKSRLLMQVIGRGNSGAAETPWAETIFQREESLSLQGRPMFPLKKVQLIK